MDLMPTILSLTSAAHPEEWRRGFHHEMFHLLDHRHGHLEGGQDEEWASLNRDGFRYGSGGWDFAKSDQMNGLTRKCPGFLTRYATSGIEEDKAELFSFMMMDYRQVDQRAAADPNLAAKVALMKERLRRFCPDIKAEFWQHLRRASFD